MLVCFDNDQKSAAPTDARRLAEAVQHVGPRMEMAHWSDSCPFGTASNVRRFRDMPIEFYFTPELHLKDGRIIRDLEDAASFAREHELRPGIDQRDEVLHKLERADSQETAHAAAHFFVRWAEELDLLD